MLITWFGLYKFMREADPAVWKVVNVNLASVRRGYTGVKPNDNTWQIQWTYRGILTSVRNLLFIVHAVYCKLVAFSIGNVLLSPSSMCWHQWQENEPFIWAKCRDVIVNKTPTHWFFLHIPRQTWERMYIPHVDISA